MKIAVAADHAGFELKERIAESLTAAGHELIDFGTDSDESVDYPDFAEPAARAVASGEAERGVFVCGSGVGVAIVANKVDGVRAVHAHDANEAAMSRHHNNANVITLGQRGGEVGDPVEIVNRFLETEFDGGRHERRVEKITAVEEHTTALAEAKENNA